MEYQIRPYTPLDKPGVLALRVHLGDEEESANRAYFEWKYEANPCLDGPVFVVACLGDRIVGIRGLYATPWTNPSTGEAFVLPHADDLVIDPEHRGRGLFLPIMEALLREAADRGFSHVLSLSGGGVTQQLSLATGWASLGDIERVVRVRRRGAGRASELVGRVAGRLRRLAGGGERVRPRLPAERAIDAVVARIVGSDATISGATDLLLDRLEELVPTSPGTRVSAGRTREYVEWRLRNPGRRYRVVHRDAGASQGAMVLSWNGPDARAVTVAEILATDDDAFGSLLTAVSSRPELEIRAGVGGLSASRRNRMADLGFVPLRDARPDEQQRRFLITATGAGGGPLPSEATMDGSVWRYALLETMQV